MESWLNVTLSKVIFLHFQNMSISFSYALNLLQNSSVNYVFSVHFETPPNCYRNVQLFTTLKSKFCQVIQNTATTVSNSTTQISYNWVYSHEEILAENYVPIFNSHGFFNQINFSNWNHLLLAWFIKQRRPQRRI